MPLSAVRRPANSITWPSNVRHVAWSVVAGRIVERVHVIEVEGGEHSAWPSIDIGLCGLATLRDVREREVGVAAFGARQ